MILLSQNTGLFGFDPREAQDYAPSPQPIWEEVSLLTKEPYPTNFLIADCEKHLAPGVRARLVRWLEFFNDHYHLVSHIYNRFVFSLMEGTLNGNLVARQTAHQFETSLRFLKVLLKMPLRIDPDDQQVAPSLLQLALIVGLYPGMIICGKPKAFEETGPLRNTEDVTRLFLKLFGRYPVPQPLTQNLASLSDKEIGAVMHIWYGKNIRTYEGLPFPLSKKEAHYFINAEYQQVPMENHLLIRMIVLSKLLAAQPHHPHLAYRLLGCSHSFDFDPSRFYDDLPFWQQLLRLQVQMEKDPELYSGLQECVDFLEYKKYSEGGDGYSLKGRSPRSLHRAVADWHRTQNFMHSEEDLLQKWGSESGPAMDLKLGPDSYRISEITSGEELWEESQKLHHCAFSYTPHCASGFTQLWSVKKMQGTTYHSLLTLEVRVKTIVQARGLRNRALSKKEVAIVQEWALKQELRFGVRGAE